MGRLQIVGQRYLKRQEHVWYKKPDGTYKCVLCGGLSAAPAELDSEAPLAVYEPLTDAERDMCPRNDR